MVPKPRRGRYCLVSTPCSRGQCGSWVKTTGLEFDASNSSKYQPLTDEDLRRTLASIEGKAKDSKMLQVADACLWAISKSLLLC